MNRFRIVLLGLALAFGALPAAAQTREKITVAFPTVDPTAEVLYAYDMGFFDKVGLDVTLQPLANGGAIAAGVVSGAIDIGVGNVIAIETAHKKGLPLTIIAPGAANVNSLASNVLIVKKDSTLRTARDLNGLVIATNPLRSIGDLMISAWIDKNGGDSTTIKYIEIPFPQAEGVGRPRYGCGVAQRRAVHHSSQERHARLFQPVRGARRWLPYHGVLCRGAVGSSASGRCREVCVGHSRYGDLG